MDAKMKEMIDAAKIMCIEGEQISAEILLEFLELDPYSEECAYLGRASRDVAFASGNKARIGSSIGIDLVPCTMNCRFCSLGEEWGLVSDIQIMPENKIIDIIRNVLADGHFQFTIRTTEFYDLEKLGKLGKRIRSEVPGIYGLSANTGELTADQANYLFDCGFTGAYHTVRLGEGKDTPFDPEVRIETMRSISRSNLMLSCGVDPVGAEHTNKEIIERLMLFRTMNPVSVCAMRRVNVAGTPFEGVGEVDDMRMSQIAAVIRMAGGKEWNVAIHPVIRQAMDWGANLVAVETGAVPRRKEQNFVEWSICSHDAAKKEFIDAGYDMGEWDNFKR